MRMWRTGIRLSPPDADRSTPAEHVGESQATGCCAYRLHAGRPAPKASGLAQDQDFQQHRQVGAADHRHAGAGGTRTGVGWGCRRRGPPRSARRRGIHPAATAAPSPRELVHLLGRLQPMTGHPRFVCAPTIISAAAEGPSQGSVAEQTMPITGLPPYVRRGAGSGRPRPRCRALQDAQTAASPKPRTSTDRSTLIGDDGGPHEPVGQADDEQRDHVREDGVERRAAAPRPSPCASPVHGNLRTNLIGVVTFAMMRRDEAAHHDQAHDGRALGDLLHAAAGHCWDQADARL